MKILVKSLTGQTTEAIVSDAATLLELKTSIEALLGVPRDIQKILFAGRELEDDQAKLAENSVADQAVVHLIVKVVFTPSPSTVSGRPVQPAGDEVAHRPIMHQYDPRIPEGTERKTSSPEEIIREALPGQDSRKILFNLRILRLTRGFAIVDFVRIVLSCLKFSGFDSALRFFVRVVLSSSAASYCRNLWELSLQSLVGTFGRSFMSLGAQCVVWSLCHWNDRLSSCSLLVCVLHWKTICRNPVCDLCSSQCIHKLCGFSLLPDTNTPLST